MGSDRFVVFSGVSPLADAQRTVDPDSAVLRFVADRGIPLVLCSGRTRAEMEFVQQTAGLSDPFVAEHGSAAFVRDGYFPRRLVDGTRLLVGYAVMEMGRPYAQVVELLRRASARARVEVVGFSEMSVDEVAVECGLPLLEARLAKLRDYEEAFRIVDPDAIARARLWRALQSAQLGCVTEGRLDFAGAPVDLGVGAQWLTTLYRKAAGSTVTVGIGDKPHHLPMLRRVDMPIIASCDPTTTRRLSAALPRALVVDRGAGPSLVEALGRIVGSITAQIAMP